MPQEAGSKTSSMRSSLAALANMQPIIACLLWQTFDHHQGRGVGPCAEKDSNTSRSNRFTACVVPPATSPEAHEGHDSESLLAIHAVELNSLAGRERASSHAKKAHHRETQSTPWRSSNPRSSWPRRSHRVTKLLVAPFLVGHPLRTSPGDEEASLATSCYAS